MNVTVRVSTETNDDGSECNEPALFRVAVGAVGVVVDNVLDNLLEAGLLAAQTQLLYERLNLQGAKLALLIKFIIEVACDGHGKQIFFHPHKAISQSQKKKKKKKPEKMMGNIYLHSYTPKPVPRVVSSPYC
jgi:hypothetical protein